MTLIVNLFGGPGTGKSTNAARIFALLKDENVNCELVTEFAKDLVWEERLSTFDDDLYILAKQNHRLFRLIDKVDVVITDSPLLIKLIYMRDKDLPMEDLVLNIFKRYDNANFFLKRYKDYNPAGRFQNEDEAKGCDEDIRCLLDKYEIDYREVDGTKEGAEFIASAITRRLRNG
jgi:hypothetical protein